MDELEHYILELREVKIGIKDVVMTPPSRKIMKKVIDAMESLWDMEITTQNKNPKGTTKGKCPIFIFNHIVHAPMGQG